MSEEEYRLESPGSHESILGGEESDAIYRIASQKRLAAYMSTDSDFWIFQHFNRLNLFRIVYLQQRLADLEERLDQAVPEGVWKCDMPVFKDLMPEIESTLKQYEDALISQTRHKSFRKPSQRSLDMVGKRSNNQAWRGDYKLCVGNKDKISKYVCIAAEEKGWIHKAVDRRSLLRRMFAEKGSQDMASSSILLYSESKVRRAEQMIINIAFCFLLIFPILILSHVANETLKLSIVLVFILILSTFTIDLAESTHKTNIALVAPYAAILVVFLTTGSGS